jgi:Putative metal-binding motif
MYTHHGTTRPMSVLSQPLRIEGESSMHLRIRTAQALGLGAFLLPCLAIAACSDAVCPSGTTQEGDRCRTDALTAKDAGSDASDEHNSADPSSTNANVPTSPTAGTSAAAGTNAGAGIAGGSGASGSSAGAGSEAAANTAGQSGSGAQSGAGGPMMAMSTGPCASGAAPLPEMCDGKDNDCDGGTDEQIPDADCGSSTQGVCRMGRKTCAAGQWSECAGAVEPSTEMCDPNRLDEDCNGTANERCACTPGETQECGKTGGICKKGKQTCSAAAAWGSECEGAVNPQAEICDGEKDEDCDGRADRDDPDCECVNGTPEPCVAGRGICAAGTRRCNTGKWSACMPVTAPQPEMCDGMDNDCDGSADNNASCPSGQVCSNGRCGCREGMSMDCTVASTSGPCARGKRTCRSGEWSDCASSTTPQRETCDGVDNDCNGKADDGNLCPNGRACVQSGATVACASCSTVTVAMDCTEQMPCRKPSCSTSGSCEYVPVEELTPCARENALEGFCKSGRCDPPGRATGNRMNPGEALQAGEKLVNGIYSLTCQSDGNLVLSHSDGTSELVDWSSGSSGAAAACVMQPDGNLVIYGAQMNVIWASHTAVAGTYVGNYLLLGQNSLNIMSSSGTVVLALR